MSDLDKLHEELNVQFAKEAEERKLQEQKEEQERLERERQEKIQKRKDFLKVVAKKIKQPFVDAKTKRTLKNAAKLVAEEHQKRKIEAEEAKKAEEARIAAEKHQERVNNANTEIDKVKALYDPNKVGTVEIFTREEPKFTIGGKPIDPDVYTTTVLHTEYGPLVRTVKTNDYPPSVNPYCIEYKGFIKQNDQIVYVHQRANCVRHPRWDYDTKIIREEFVKTKDGNIDFTDSGEIVYQSVVDNVPCPVTAYFEEQLQKCQDKSSDKQ